MGTFLLFGSGMRLERVADVGAGPFGCVDPLSVFFPDAKGAEGFKALEVDPKVLQGIRPQVFQELTMHAAMVPMGLQVDPWEDCQKRLQKWTIETQEDEVLRLATQLGSLRQAEAVLEGLPDRHQRLKETLEEQLGRARLRLHHLRESIVEVQLPRVLVDLGGKILPL